MHSIGIEWDVAGDDNHNAEGTVLYRPAGNSVWKRALPLIRVDYQGKNMLVFEIGSGPHVQTVRVNTRRLRKEFQANIVRINPKDYAIKAPNIGLATGALDALAAIDAYLRK